jgi:hypothetical protein
VKPPVVHSTGGFFSDRSHMHIALIITLALGSAAWAELPRIRFSEPPHSYWERSPQDAVTQLLQRIRAGEVSLDASSEKAYLLSVLDALDIPESSQMLVFSGTSLQSGLIRPTNPRAIFFNEEVYVGYVPGGRLELVAIDGEMGPVFQIFGRGRGPVPEGERTERCMNCHAGRAMHRLPGFFTESVIPSASGGSLDGFKRDMVGHTVPLSERFGGWHITGAHERDFELSNLMGRSTAGKLERIKNPPGSQFSWDAYPVGTSDLLTHLIHEHQLGFHNLVTLGLYRSREVLHAGGGTVREEHVPVLNDVARELVRYLLFANEAKLPAGGVHPDKTYERDFLAKRIAAKNGASLRDLDMRSRLFRHRCSYLIYTPGFQALPAVFKTRVYAGLRSALSDQGLPEFSYLSLPERQAIRGILRDTLQDLPADF